MTTETTIVVTPWHDPDQRDRFLDAWDVLDTLRPDLVLQHDANREGCAVTKNKGVAEALRRGADTVVVLDDDCFPTTSTPTLTSLVLQHLEALRPQPVTMFAEIADPPPRGTPFQNRSITMPVAASMGFWSDVPDYCAVRQLAFDCGPMEFRPSTIVDRYFPLCGMNLAFRPADWAPWCSFIDVPRFDDIWMGWLWQREAYRRRACFNTAGPIVRHSRQSNVWANLRDEVTHLQSNDTLWRDIATHASDDYDTLNRLLPHHD